MAVSCFNEHLELSLQTGADPSSPRKQSSLCSLRSLSYLRLLEDYCYMQALRSVVAGGDCRAVRISKLTCQFQVQDIVLDYTNCFKDAPNGTLGPMPTNLVTKHFKTNSSNPTQGPPQWMRRDVTATYGNGSTVHATVPTIECTLQFGIPNEMKPPVLFYYKLTNFYQNHRRYAKSFSTDQLSGKAVSLSGIDGSDCTGITSGTKNGVKKPYYPCGLAANSVFNDTFSSPVLLNVNKDAAVEGEENTNSVYLMNNNSGISWSSDRDLYGQSKYNWADVYAPPNWHDRYPNDYSDDYHPDLVNDGAFQVWMRLAGLPTFSKLAQRNDDKAMTVGTYQVAINHRTFSRLSSFFIKLTCIDFNVTEYGGTKSIIISTSTVVGGRNPFLGIAYVVVAGICVLLGTLFTVTHLIKPRKLGDHTYLSWNNETPAATATGRDAAPSEGGRMEA